MRRRVLALASALLASALAVPPSTAAAPPPVPEGFYGTWYDALKPRQRRQRAALRRAGRNGAEHDPAVRVLEPHRGLPRRVRLAPGLDEVVKDAGERGLTILPTLLYPPDFYRATPAARTGSVQHPPDDPEAMARFATALVERYGPRGVYWCPPWVPRWVPRDKAEVVEDAAPCDDGEAIRTWEVWNEPDLKAWWRAAPDSREYARLLTSVSAAIKRADPDAEVVSAR